MATEPKEPQVGEHPEGGTLAPLSGDSKTDVALPSPARLVRPAGPSDQSLEVMRLVQAGGTEAFSRWLVNQGQVVIVLPYIELPGLLAPGIRLASGDLKGAVFTGGNLSGGDFTGANLAGILANKCGLRGTNFTGAILDAAIFTQADLTEARFLGANLAGTIFTGCDLTKADFTGSYMVGAYFTSCRLIGAKFAGTARAGAYLPPGLEFSPAGVVIAQKQEEDR